MFNPDLYRRYEEASKEIEGVVTHVPSLDEMVDAILATIDGEPLVFKSFDEFFNWWDVVTAYDALDGDDCAELYKPVLRIAYEALPVGAA